MCLPWAQTPFPGNDQSEKLRNCLHNDCGTKMTPGQSSGNTNRDGQGMYHKTGGICLFKSWTLVRLRGSGG